MAEVTPYNEHYPTPGLTLGLPEAVPERENIDTLLSGNLVNTVYEHIQDKRRLTDPERGASDMLDPRPDIGRDPDTEAMIAEENIVVGALERVRFFVQEKQEQLTEKLQHSSFAQHAKKLGAIAATSVALLGVQATPAGEKLTEKTPIPTIAGDALKTPEAKAEIDVAEIERKMAEYRKIGEQYPWKDAPIGSRDKWDGTARVCDSYTMWRFVEKNGISEKRYNDYRWSGEIIDKTPATGAMGVNDRHKIYFEEVTKDYMIVSDYNGSGGDYDYGITWVPRDSDRYATFDIVHFEIPNPRFDNKNDTTNPNNPNIYKDAKYDRRNRNAITARKAIKSGTFIRSANKQFNLTVDSGLLRLDDTKKDQDTTNDETVWQIRAPKKATQLKVELGKGKQRGKNRLVFTDYSGKRRYKSWYIGKANRLVLNNRGEIVGLKGRKPTAKTDKSIAHIALASRRAERRQARIMRVKKQKAHRLAVKQKRLSKRS